MSQAKTKTRPRKGATRGLRRAGAASPAGAAGQPIGPPPVHLTRATVSALGEWTAGDRCHAEGRAVDPGDAFTILDFQVPDDPEKRPWANVYGGSGQYRSLRSFDLAALRPLGWEPAPTEAQLAAYEAARNRPGRKTAPEGDAGLGLALRAAREAAGLSRAKLSEATGIHHARIQQAEAGQRGLSDEELDALTAALGEFA